MDNIKEKGMGRVQKPSSWEAMGLIPNGLPANKKAKLIKEYDSAADFFTTDEDTTVHCHEGDSCLEMIIFPIICRLVIEDKWPKGVSGSKLCHKIVKYPIEKIPEFKKEGMDIDWEAELCAWIVSHISDIVR